MVFRNHPGALVLCVLALALAAAPAFAERDVLPFLDYRTESWFLPQSPGVTAGPAGGLFNPSVWAMNDRVGSDFWWNTSNVRRGLDNYGFGIGKNINFAMNTTTWGTEEESYQTYDYQLGLAKGSRLGAFGLSYRWAHGETDRQPRQKTLGLGLAGRPRSWSSFGAAANISLESSAAQYVFDLGLRPIGRDWLTLFADWTVHDDQSFWSGGVWGAGVELRPARGLHLGARVRERPVTGDLDYSLVAGLTFGMTNIMGMPLYDEARGDFAHTSWLVRSTPPFRGMEEPKTILGGGGTIHPISLENKVLTYQKYRYFDNKRVAWLDLLNQLNILLADDRTGGVALNLAGFRARPSLAWELRTKLEEFRAAGKTVIVHGDRFEPVIYYLASAADRITLDPQGLIALPGYALRRSYLKGTLEKLGLGFQEFRYLEYKSAMEALSREDMSEADREQRQRIVDVLYETTRKGVAERRGISPAEYDRIVDEVGLITPAEALELGLIDAVARWDGVTEDTDWKKPAKAHRAALDFEREYWDEQWGAPSVVPVVYAVGICAMDSGIKGRKTSAYLRSLVSNPHVKAVVLRADSPGGDALPSDLIAEAIQDLREAGKPVIVTQGDLAASGGYWVSMDGSEILTTPLTVTGSIGVIGGWIWDDGLMDKVGVTSEAVQRGRHADLFRTVNLPFVGGVPARPMDEEELARAKTMILDMYDEFVERVAAGRGLTPEAVHEVAQGRVWMGDDALERGLVDRIGTLDQAIGLAREQAGIPDWQRVKIVEFPPRPAIEWPSFMPSVPGLFGFGARVNDLLARLYRPGEKDAALAVPAPYADAAGLPAGDLEFLRSLAALNGEPVLALPPDAVPEAWREID